MKRLWAVYADKKVIHLIPDRLHGSRHLALAGGARAVEPAARSAAVLPGHPMYPSAFPRPQRPRHDKG
jgi:hypothetical protein